MDGYNVKQQEFLDMIDKLDGFLKSEKNITTFQLLPFDMNQLKEKYTKSPISVDKLITIFWKLFIKQIFFLEQKLSHLATQNSELRIRIDNKIEEN